MKTVIIVALIILTCASPVILLILSLLHDGRKLREEARLLHRRRVEDDERERLAAEPGPPKGQARPQGKGGIFDAQGQRVTLNPAEFCAYVRTPTLVRAFELDFDGELRDSRGVRRFLVGDYYCENDSGCAYITSAPYMSRGYKRVEAQPFQDEETKPYPPDFPEGGAFV